MVNPDPQTARELLSPDFIRRMEHLDVQARQLFSGKLPGERRSKKRGQSVEYADFRPYVPGDDLRFIDWKIFARLDRLILRVFLEEQDVAVNIVLDTSPSMEYGSPAKMLYGRQLAAALGYLALVHLNRVTVESASGSGLFGLHDLRGRRPVSRLFNYLENLETGRPGRLADSLRLLASQPKRRGIVVLISDLLDPDPNASVDETLRFLGDPRFEAYMLHVLSPQELDPTLAELQGDLELVDIESNNAVPVTINPKAMERYRQRLKAFQDEVAVSCRRRGIGLVSIDTQTPLEQVVLQDLQRIGLLA
ncbi:MAG: DUF58 domain-containing protein [Phycisphaeraceae bacterium]|nr:DUF58 domain-containing protein [Phycisphaeraceae bacterium]